LLNGDGGGGGGGNTLGPLGDSAPQNNLFRGLYTYISTYYECENKKVLFKNRNRELTNGNESGFISHTILMD